MLGVYAVLDLHCHILPNLDDGAQTMDESLEMAALAASSGVHYIFATPHCNTRDPRKNYRSAPLIAAYETLQQALDDRQIPITILSGAEVLARGDFEAHLEAEDFMTLNGSRYLLTEFYFDEAPAYMEHCLQAVEAARLVPVIAHPERYFCIQRNPGLATDWAERGRILQINKGSLLGTQRLPDSRPSPAPGSESRHRLRRPPCEPPQPPHGAAAGAAGPKLPGN